MTGSVFCCGFECGVDCGSGIGGHWDLVTNASFSTSTVRSGLRAMRFNASPGVSSINTVFSSAFQTSWVGRLYIRFATLPSGDTALVAVDATPTGPCVRFKQSDSKLYAGVGTTLGATGIAVTTGQWYLIDFKFTISVGGNDTCDVRVDSSACGQATATGLSATAATVFAGAFSSVTHDFYIDDVVLSQATGDYPIGDGYVNHFVPTSDGTHNIAGTGDFQRTLTGTDILNATTTAFQLVDDVPLEAIVTDWINMLLPVNATDYVECIFGPAPGISTPTVAPRVVEVVCGINQAGTGAGNMEIRLNDNGSMGTVYTATGVAGVAVATRQVFQRAHFTDPPSAASVWTLSGDGNFNNLRIRFGSPAALDVNPDQYFGCAMIEAEFPPAVSIFADRWHPLTNQPYPYKTEVIPY